MASQGHTPDEELLQAVRGVLNDFSRRVRQAHSFDEIDAHREELATLIVDVARRSENPSEDVLASLRPGRATRSSHTGD